MGKKCDNECEYFETYNAIEHNWDLIAKPLDSLGKFEKVLAKIGAVQKNIHPQVNKSAVLILCSDNGIVEEGVSQSDQSITKICSENIAAMKTVVGIMAKQSGTDVIAIDMGINCDEKLPGVVDRKIRKGTFNFLKQPAMSESEMNQAIQTGINLVKDCKEKGYNILCIGEMGIGNTTTSTAVAASILHRNAKDITGRGAGLSDEGLSRKAFVIQEAIDKFDLYNKTPEEVLMTVGGFDIAGMVGVYFGAKKFNIPVVLDGAISMTAILVAEMMEPGIKNYVIPSHKSREPLAEQIMKNLNLDCVIDAGMALGEGTGAALMIQIIKTISEVYETSVPFEASNVQQYTRFDK